MGNSCHYTKYSYEKNQKKPKNKNKQTNKQNKNVTSEVLTSNTDFHKDHVFPYDCMLYS